MYGLILAASTMAPLQGFWNFIVYARPRYFGRKGMAKIRTDFSSALTRFWRQLRSGFSSRGSKVIRRLSTRGTHMESGTKTNAKHVGDNSDGTSPANKLAQKSSLADDRSISIESEAVPFVAPDSSGDTPADEPGNDGANNVSQEPGFTIRRSSISSRGANFIRRISTRHIKDENITDTNAKHHGDNVNNLDEKSSPAKDKLIEISSDASSSDLESPGDTKGYMDGAAQAMDPAAETRKDEPNDNMSLDGVAQAILEDNTMNPTAETRKDEPNDMSLDDVARAIPEDTTMNPTAETGNDEPNYMSNEPVANQDDVIDDNDARFEMMLAG